MEEDFQTSSNNRPDTEARWGFRALAAGESLPQLAVVSRGTFVFVVPGLLFHTSDRSCSLIHIYVC